MMVCKSSQPKLHMIGVSQPKKKKDRQRGEGELQQGNVLKFRLLCTASCLVYKPTISNPLYLSIVRVSRIAPRQCTSPSASDRYLDFCVTVLPVFGCVVHTKGGNATLRTRGEHLLSRDDVFLSSPLRRGYVGSRMVPMILRHSVKSCSNKFRVHLVSCMDAFLKLQKHYIVRAPLLEFADRRIFRYSDRHTYITHRSQLIYL